MSIEIEELGNELGAKNSLNKTSHKRAREKLQLRKETGMKERDVEVLLREGVKQLGGRAYKWVSPGNAGVPDRIVILPGGVIHFVEIKQENGCMSNLQFVQQEKLRALGAVAVTLYGASAVRYYLERVEGMIRNEVKTARLPAVLY
nr:MAG TPA: Nuclease [Caudoviricetes sp.]